MLEAAAAGTVDTLVLLGADLEEDFPDRIRMRAGLDAVKFVVAVGAFTDDAAARADVFLPTSVWGEKSGTTTNLEGRVMRQARLITPEGTTMEDWRIAQELAARFGAEFGLDTVEDVQDEIARVAPAHAGVDADLVRRARDGAVLPIADFPDEIVFTHVLGVTTGRTWEPIPPGVAADESHLSSLGTGAVAASGTGADVTIKPGLATGDAPEDDEAAELAVEHASEELEARPALARVGPHRDTAHAHAARRVQSPPRGRPHALRRRKHRVVEPVARRARRPASRWSCTRATSSASA